MSFSKKDYTKEYSKLHYTKQLLESNKERKRLTNSLVELVSAVCEQIAEESEVGTFVQLEEKFVLRIAKFHSLYGSQKFLVVERFHDEDIDLGVIADKEPSSFFALHHDQDCLIQVADKESFLYVVNNLIAIINAFQADTEATIGKLREAFKKLKVISD